MVDRVEARQGRLAVDEDAQLVAGIEQIGPILLSDGTRPADFLDAERRDHRIAPHDRNSCLRALRRAFAHDDRLAEAVAAAMAAATEHQSQHEAGN